MATEYLDDVILDEIGEENEANLTAPDFVNSIEPAKSQVICIASGKGGTGKTMIATNLSVLLAREGLSVVLLDADFGLANSHLLLGIEPQHDISSVLASEKTATDILLDGPEGLKLLPGGSGLSEMAMLGDEKFLHLIKGLKKVEEKADIIIVDLPAGISPQVLCLFGAAHETIIVTTPEVTSLVDAYAMIKSLSKITEKATVQIIVNRAPDKSRAIVAFQKLYSIANKHLHGNVSLKFLGWLPQNWYVLNSVACRKPVVLRHPQSFVTASLELMAAKTLKRHLKWLETKSINNENCPSYFGKLEHMIYGR